MAISWQASIKFMFLWLLITNLTGTSSESKHVKLRGAGASFPAAVYKNWLPTYKAIRHQFVSLEMTYDSIGSGGGKTRIKANKTERDVEYAGSDSLLKDSDYQTHPDLQMFPTMAGAVVVAFNIPGVSQLNLSREHVVGIYNGSIRWWNDSSIQDLNSGLSMPGEKMVVISRADKSGTTEIFTSALASFSAQWRSKFGIFSKGLNSDGLPEVWNSSVIAYYGQTNRGMSGLIMSIAYSVGYMSAADAQEAGIYSAHLQNRAGTIVKSNPENVQSAMDDYTSSFSPQFTASLSDGGGTFSYPIAGYTYFVIYMDTMPNCDSAVELFRFVDWFLFDEEAQKVCKDLNMVPLSKSVANKIQADILSLMTCRGQRVYQLTAEQVHQENIIRQTWRTPLFASIPLLLIVIFLLIGFLAHQQYKVNKAIIRGEWRISIGDIQIVDGRKKNSIKLSRLSILKSLRSISVADGTTSSNPSVQWVFEQAIIGKWTDHLVCLWPTEVSDFKELKTRTKRKFLWMRDTVNHTNILRFYGVTARENKVHVVSEYCSKGVLHDVLQNDKFNFDNNFKFSLASDIADGMKFLHHMDIVHGSLSSSCCFIDARWNVKIAGWELLAIATSQGSSSMKYTSVGNSVSELSDENITARKKYYTAPEFFNKPDKDPKTKSMDVFSYGILLTEIFTREDPYLEYTDKFTPVEVLCKIQTEGLRQTLTQDIPVTVRPLITSAWSSNPANRPTFSALTKGLYKAKPSKKSVMDCMMEAVEEYVTHLEEKIEERTHELAIAMRNMEGLLHKILPPTVAERLYKGEPVSPEAFTSVTLFFSDIVGFTSISAASSPMQIVTMLNDLYTCFDSVVDEHDVYKVETIGDAYMVISGLPRRNGDSHAAEIASMAIVLMVESSKFTIRHRPNDKLRIRAGIHTGPVVAGVVGTKMPRYCLFGDTVNTAARMESTSLPMHVQITDSTKELLPQHDHFRVMHRGHVDIKGKGSMKTFWLYGKGSLMCPSAPELVTHGAVAPGVGDISVA